MIFDFLGPYRRSTRTSEMLDALKQSRVLRQTCACGATVEIDPDKSWAPNGVVLDWWQTHPCPIRNSKKEKK